MNEFIFDRIWLVLIYVCNSFIRLLFFSWVTKFIIILRFQTILLIQHICHFLWFLYHVKLIFLLYIMLICINISIFLYFIIIFIISQIFNIKLIFYNSTIRWNWLFYDDFMIWLLWLSFTLIIMREFIWFVFVKTTFSPFILSSFALLHSLNYLHSLNSLASLAFTIFLFLRQWAIPI